MPIAKTRLPPFGFMRLEPKPLVTEHELKGGRRFPHGFVVLFSLVGCEHNKNVAYLLQDRLTDVSAPLLPQGKRISKMQTRRHESRSWEELWNAKLSTVSMDALRSIVQRSEWHARSGLKLQGHSLNIRHRDQQERTSSPLCRNMPSHQFNSRHYPRPRLLLWLVMHIMSSRIVCINLAPRLFFYLSILVFFIIQVGHKDFHSALLRRAVSGCRNAEDRAGSRMEAFGSLYGIALLLLMQASPQHGQYW